jgi:hypothetical protein
MVRGNGAQSAAVSARQTKGGNHMSDPDPLNRFLFRPTNWLGLGTEAEETDYPGYARQRITLTAEIRFPRLLGFLNADITHMQVWTAETGGEMLAIGKRFGYAAAADFRIGRRFGDMRIDNNAIW